MSVTLKMAVLLFVVFIPSYVSAQHLLNGRIDLTKKQEQAEQENKKDLIFKTNKPLPPMVGNTRFRTGTSLCEVEVASSYSQMGDFVEVETIVENNQCGPSNGKYIVNVRTQDKAGNINLSKYEEVWSRADAESVQLEHRYSMNGDAELVSARIRMPSRDYCSCLE
jgi:hypothetical protein